MLEYVNPGLSLPKEIIINILNDAESSLLRLFWNRPFPGERRVVLLFPFGGFQHHPLVAN